MLPLFGYEEGDGGDGTLLYQVIQKCLIALLSALTGAASIYFGFRIKNRRLDLENRDKDIASAKAQTRFETAKENKIIQKYERLMEHQDERLAALEKRLDAQQKVLVELAADHSQCRAENAALEMRMGYYEHIMRENGIKFTPFEQLCPEDDRFTPPKSPTDPSP